MRSEICKYCGSTKIGGICLNCQELDSARRFHRDLLLLFGIAALCVVAFFFTRFVAAKERQMDSRTAAGWYESGEKSLKAGQVDTAIDYFRRATSDDYENRQYHLALAEALGQAGKYEEARYSLLRLREGAPENAEINLQLARIEAKRNDVSEAVRYFHNALYGRWTGNHVDEEQRKVRMELIDFYLNHQQRTQALSELLILESEVPDDAGSQRELAQLFLASGAPSPALKHFLRAAHLAKHDSIALAGAGEASFQLGDYAQAHRLFESSVAIRDDNSVRSHLDLTKAVLANDPLAPRIGFAERTRRLQANLDQGISTLEKCMNQVGSSTDEKTASLSSVHGSAIAARQQLLPQNVQRNPELLESGVELIGKIEEAAESSCQSPQGLDKALLLIARKYRGTQQ